MEDPKTDPFSVMSAIAAVEGSLNPAAPVPLAPNKPYFPLTWAHTQEPQVLTTCAFNWPDVVFGSRLPIQSARSLTILLGFCPWDCVLRLLPPQRAFFLFCS